MDKSEKREPAPFTGSPSLIKRLPSGPMPKNYYENPIPPADPKYLPVWREAMAECARNHPNDPVYAPFRFRRDDDDDE